MIQKDIGELDCTRQVFSTEGIEPSQLVRVRLQFLVAQNNAAIIQMQFADAKAAALMTLMGLVGLRGPVQLVPLNVADPYLLVTFAMYAACLIFSIWSIIPRYPAPSLRRWLYTQDRYSWPALAHNDPEAQDYAEFIQTSQAGQLLTSMAQSNQSLSRILVRKFLWLRVAFWFAIIFIGLLMLRAADIVPPFQVI